MRTLRDLGVNHVAFNLKPSQRDAGEVLEELAAYVLPEFPRIPPGSGSPADRTGAEA